MKTRNKKRYSTALWKLLLGVPLILGTAGFLKAGVSLQDALFNTLSMYGMQIQDTTPNWLVELTRWTAPLATASGVLMVFASFRRKVLRGLLYLTTDSVAVYGPEEPRNAEGIPEETRETLSELEHIRWNRYHLLNNWQYGVPETGKRKDPEKRLHMDLVEYQALSREEKDKDWGNIRTLLSVQRAQRGRGTVFRVCPVSPARPPLSARAGRRPGPGAGGPEKGFGALCRRRGSRRVHVCTE